MNAEQAGPLGLNGPTVAGHVPLELQEGQDYAREWLLGLATTVVRGFPRRHAFVADNNVLLMARGALGLCGHRAV